VPETALQRDGESTIDRRAFVFLEAGVGIDLREFLRIRRVAQRDLEIKFVDRFVEDELVGVGWREECGVCGVGGADARILGVERFAVAEGATREAPSNAG
jgi:hypothetical protein